MDGQIRRMSGWVNGWMDGWVDRGWMSGWMDKELDEEIPGWGEHTVQPKTTMRRHQPVGLSLGSSYIEATEITRLLTKPVPGHTHVPEMGATGCLLLPCSHDSPTGDDSANDRVGCLQLHSS